MPRLFCDAIKPFISNMITERQNALSAGAVSFSILLELVAAAGTD